MPTANAAAVPLRSRSPRVSDELEPVSSSATSATTVCLLSSVDSLAERTACKALDETVEERVVEQRERDRRDQRRRHQRLPEEDVSPDEGVRDPRRHRSLIRARGERERGDEH